LESPETKVDVYPNPFNESLTIRMETQITEIVIFSMTGSVVYKETLKNHQSAIDTKFIAPGSYIINVRSNNLITHAKLIKL
jgi:hypothetical protein